MLGQSEPYRRILAIGSSCGTPPESPVLTQLRGVRQLKLSRALRANDLVTFYRQSFRISAAAENYHGMGDEECSHEAPRCTDAYRPEELQWLKSFEGRIFQRPAQRTEETGEASY